MKKEKVKVKICVGTACFVQGGADLLLYNDFVEPEVLAYCEIEGSPCLSSCKNASAEVEGNAPYVMINDRVYGDMTQEKFAKLLSEAVNA